MSVSRPGNCARSRRCASIIALSSPACVEAAAITGRRADGARSAASFVGVAGRRRHVELEVAGGDDARRAERRERSASPAVRQGKDRSAAADRRSSAGKKRQRLNERSDSRPLTRIIGMRAARRLHDQVRPQIGFDEQREIGPPMVEEARARSAARRAARIDGSRPRGSRSVGESAEVTVPDVTSTLKSRARDALDQRQHARQFADAGAMQPDQRARRARPARVARAAPAAARPAPCRAADARLSSMRRQRRRRRRQQPVGAQGCRQPVAHDAASSVARRRSHRRARSRG